MKNVLFFFLALSSIVFCACNAPKVVAADTGMVEITETYWRLVELRSKLVPRPTTPDKKEIHIKLKKDGSVEGFAGCNGFGGHFELKDSSGIAFTNLMGTMMACGDLTTENKLFEVLREADNYIHLSKKLILNKAKMAPLARFEADFWK